MVQFDDQKFEVKTNFTAGNVGQAYARLFKETGTQASGLDCGITLEQFKKGYTFLAFDLTADRTPEDARINLVRQGNRPWTEGPKSDFSFQHPGHYFFSMVLHSLRAV